jgi:hypothetical protein
VAYRPVSLHQWDCDARLPIFLFAYRASTHDTMDLTPASLVFRTELQQPCDLLFGEPPDKERPTINHAANFVDHLHDIQNYACQHQKLASDWVKTHYDRLANSMGYHKDDKVWLYCLTGQRENYPSSNPYGSARTG